MVWLKAESKEQTLTPTSSGCFLGGVVPVHVKMNSCDYLFTAGNTTDPKVADTVQIEMHIRCNTAGDRIEIEATGSTCKTTIPPQTLTGIETHNRTDTTVNPPRIDVEMTLDVHSLTYECHGTCPNHPVQTTLFHNGTYNGVATLTSHGPNA